MMNENPFDTMSIDEIYEELHQEGQRLSSGGGGFVAECAVEIGYKVYLGREDGVEQADTFHAFSFSDKVAEKAALANAKKMLTTAGKTDRRPQFGVQITAFKDGAMVRGEPVTWQGDRYFNADWWTEASTQVVIPSMRAAGVRHWPWRGWARIVFANDPWKEAQGIQDEETPDGIMRYKQVAHIAEVFDSQEDAYAAAGMDAETVLEDTSNWKPQADGWSTTDLVATAGAIQEEATKGKNAKQIAEDYALTVPDVLVVLEAHLEQGPPNVVAGKHGVSVTDVTAARKHGEGSPFDGKPF